MKYKTAIVMSTYNGEKYLEQQILSIKSQKEVNVDIYIRDDGSSDNTINILKMFETDNSIFVEYGSNIGYGRSYFKILNSLPKDKYDYIAFSDQDDYWQDEKIVQAIKKLVKSKDELLLYISALNYVDENLNYLFKKSFNDTKCTLDSNFIRHRMAGCTFVFNSNLLTELTKLDTSSIEFPLEHDVLILNVFLALKGNPYIDNNSYILYRQHNYNVTGMNQGIKKRIKREFIDHYSSKCKKNYRSKMAQLLLQTYKNDISGYEKKKLSLISNYKKKPSFRIKLLLDNDFKSKLIFTLIAKLEILFGAF